MVILLQSKSFILELLTDKFISWFVPTLLLANLFWVIEKFYISFGLVPIGNLAKIVLSITVWGASYKL